MKFLLRLGYCAVSLLPGLLFMGCNAKLVNLVSETAVPSNFITYTSEQDLFSIAYPPSWEPRQDTLAELEAAVKAYVGEQASGIPVKQATILFISGLPPKYSPNVVVVVEPLPAGVLNHQQLVTAEIGGMKSFAVDFKELNRIDTTLGGKEATIIEYQATFGGTPVHNIAVFSKTNDRAWAITCGSTPVDFPLYREDLYSIARSIRIKS